MSANVAVTVVAARSVTTHAPVPLQPPPLQPPKVEPLEATAVSVTVEPASKLALQLEPHPMPAGEDVTVPEPAPARETMSACWWRVKVAVTVSAALMVTVQLPVPEQPAPLQPVNVEVASAAALSVTTVDAGKVLEHEVPHVMPAGDELTVPPPVPARMTVSANGVALKVAVTFAAALIVTTHAPEPVHAPDQPAKLEAPSGVAVSVTTVPASKSVAQLAPQPMPEGALVTVPFPLPLFATLRV